VGDQFVHQAMEQQGAALGGEQSGHILCAHHGMSGDGLLTALHLAALLQPGETLADRRNQSFVSYPQRLQNVRVVNRERRKEWQQCDALVEAIAHAEAAMASEGRVLVRASGTEPLLRVMVEASSEELVNHWTSTLAVIAEKELNN
jgi:phosphoglucosamine mutase